MPITPQFLKGFFKVLFFIFLLIFIFAFVFHLLLSETSAFSNIGIAIVKTTIWLLGDLSYDETFLNDKAKLPYPAMTNIIYLLLITSITGVIINLFIYLPSDQREELQREALFFKIVRQIRLTVDLERLCLGAKLQKLTVYWQEDEEEAFWFKFKKLFIEILPGVRDMEASTTESADKLQVILEEMKELKNQMNEMREMQKYFKDEMQKELQKQIKKSLESMKLGSSVKTHPVLSWVDNTVVCTLPK